MDKYKAGLLGIAAALVLTLWVARSISAQRNGTGADTTVETTAIETTAIETTAVETTAVETTAAETTGAETQAETRAEPLDFETNADGLRIFTLEDLSYYDGTNGRPVYVAYKGIVYDVSNVPQWRGGEHHSHRAGIDFSQILDDSPHGEGILRFMPIVGVLAE